MAEFALTMLLKADVGQARGELATVPPAVTAITKALDDVTATGPAAAQAIAQTAAEAARGNTGLAQSYQSLRASVDPVYATSMRYEQALRVLDAAQADGSITDQERARTQGLVEAQMISTSAAVAQQAAAELEAIVAKQRATAAYQALLASVDPLYAASMRYEGALRILDAALENGAITDQERARTQALLEAQMIDTSGVAARAAAALRDAAAANEQHARTYEALRGSVDSIFAASRRYEAAVEALNAAQAAGVITDTERARTLELLEAQMIQTAAVGRSAGDMSNVTNLSFQANDIMMMAALGQSPMALTLQQGPQVIQILNQMRASGQAVGPAILGSVTSLINPWSLLTLGIIAGGAALFQWGLSAFDAGEEALTLEDRMEKLSDASSRVEASLDRLRMDRPAETFGNLTAEVMSLSEALLALDRAAQVDQLRATLEQILSDGIEPSAGDQFWESLFASRAAPARTAAQMAEDNYQSLTGGQGPSLDEFTRRRALIDQLALTGDIEAVTREVTRLFNDMAGDGPVSGMNADLRTMLTTIADIAISTAETEAYFNGSADAARTASQHTEALRDAALDEAEARERAARAAVDAAQADRERASGLLADLQRETDLRTAIRRYGEDSLAVAILRAAQERAVYEDMVGSLSVSGEMKAEIMASWDAANGILQVGLPDIIGAAASTASILSANLWTAAGGAWSAAQGMAAAAAAQITAMQPVTLSPAAQADRRDSMEGRLEQVSVRPTHPMILPPTVTPPPRPLDIDFGIPAPVVGAGGGTGGAGGSATGATRDDVAELIRELREEQAVLRELDPVQQELLRHREVLAVATAAERAQIEDLIRTRQDEAVAAERAQSIMSEIQSTGSDAVRGILSDLRDGDSAADVFIGALDRIADRLAEFAADQLTQSLFGGGAGGGYGVIGGWLQAMLFPGAPTAAAPVASLRPQARPFARGEVFDSPITFPMRGGGIGLMAEAGAEAIMPLTHAFGGGVGALIGGRETALPLARLASGKLGVDLGAVTSPFAMGGAFGDIASAAAPPSWRQAIAAAPANQTVAPAVITLQPIFEDRTSGGVRMEAEDYTDGDGQRQQRYIFSDVVAEGASARGGRGGKVLRQMGLRPQTRRRGG